MIVSSFELLRQSFRLYRANFWTLVGYSAWLLFPVAVYFGLSFLPQQDPFVIAGTVVASILDLIIAIWISIILDKIVDALEEKQPLDLAVFQKQSLQLFSPIITVALLQFLTILGGCLLLIIPGIIFMVWYAFSQLSVVLDGQLGKNALHFSHNLVRGRFFQVISRLITGPVLIALSYSILFGGFLALLGLIIGFDPTKILDSQEIPAWVNLLESAFEIFLVPLFTVYMTLLYKELKKNVLKNEGV